jgi:hypothetical protein
MIGYLVIGVLGAAALIFVSVPLRGGARRDLPERDIEVQEAEGRKRAALTALLDLETERDVGKLAPDEFESLRAEYEAEAVAALKELDTLGAPGAAEDDAIEAEIARIRAKLRP